MHRLSPFVALALVSFSPCFQGFSAEITVERSERGAVVKIDGRLFTEYLVRSGNKPVLWPIIGPTGKPMTRDYPMRDNPDEKKDHPHHRSLWFTHGEVNGVDFWSEKGRDGTIKLVEFTRLAGGKPATNAARNVWINPDGKKICEDRRTLRFDTDGAARWIDFDIVLKATDGAVTFGDTKEGTFGVRVAETIRVDAGQGGKLVNSRRQVNKAAWGKPAEWIDYHGPVDGQTVGIAILNHPDSFRFPTYWHARTYGLLTANPFGLHDFTGGKRSDGAYTLSPGGTMTLRYRVLLHRGDERQGRVAEAFSVYSDEAK
ncbi:MAG: PmoA family protein [Pirellulales bacterium]|nr:PmoA family protein [Pirellulales bacterium]